MLDYKPKVTSDPQLLYLRASVSLKGLAPGEYDLTIILHDEIAKGSSASQVIKFKVIPAKDPRRTGERDAPLRSRNGFVCSTPLFVDSSWLPNLDDDYYRRSVLRSSLGRHKAARQNVVIWSVR